MSDKIKYTKKYLLNLLKDNNIQQTSKDPMALVMIAMDNNLIDKDSVKTNIITKKQKKPKIERVKRVKKEKVVKEKKSVGRPKFLPTKEKKERDPKYDYLATIRTDPWGIKLTNMETGEVKNYKSFYDYNKKEKHSKTYIFSRNGKIVDGVKIEIIRASKEKDALSQK
ncbi:TPA_asm: hypothetical protein [Hydra adintovirus]|nr:TPA_asm: hypothetical protein [Hydra adintovirus]